MLRLFAFSLAAMAVSTVFVAASFMHALNAPTRPQAEFARSWQRNTIIAEQVHAVAHTQSPADRSF